MRTGWTYSLYELLRKEEELPAAAKKQLKTMRIRHRRRMLTDEDKRRILGIATVWTGLAMREQCPMVAKRQPLTPENLLERMLTRNNLAALLRATMPVEHDVVDQTYATIIGCIDPRMSAFAARALLDLRPLVAQISVPGPALSDHAIESAAISVQAHEPLILWILPHTTCAAKNLAAKKGRARKSGARHTVKALRRPEARLRKLLQHPVIAGAIRTRGMMVMLAEAESRLLRLEGCARVVLRKDRLAYRPVRLSGAGDLKWSEWTRKPPSYLNHEG